MADGVPITDGTAAPAYVDQGIPYEADGSVAVDDGGITDHYHQGLPFTAVSRLVVAIDGTVSRVESSAPFDVANRLVFGTGVVDHYSAGIPYTAAQQIKAGGGTPPVGTPNLTWDGIETYGNFTSTGNALSYNLSFYFYFVSLPAVFSVFLGSTTGNNNSVFMTAGRALAVNGPTGLAAQSADDVFPTTDTKYAVNINWNDTAADTIIATINSVEVINLVLASNAGTLNGLDQMAARSPSQAGKISGILKNVRLQNFSTAVDVEWVLDSESTVSEASTRDANTLTFSNVIAGDWSDPPPTFP